MSLQRRVTLGIVLLVGAMTVLAWTVARGALRPFEARVFEAFVDQALFVAERIEAGESPEDLAERLGVHVRRIERPPRRVLRGPPGARGKRPPPFAPPEEGLTLRETRGRRVAFPPGPRDRVFVETLEGWIAVRRDLELDGPGRRLRLLLPLAGLALIVLASALARAATRPLVAAQQGMRRLASGDLSHRLEEDGPADLVEVARAFNTMADRLDGLLRTERELMAGLSHELRTPLTRLRLEVELLRDRLEDPRRLDAMEGDLTELDQLIALLLELSRLQLGTTELSRRRSDLMAVARRAGALVDPKNHEVVFLGAGGEAEVDPALLERAVLNLLQNAFRYAPAGTSIEVCVDGPRITVSDEGPGVPEGDLARLFDPFWRGEASRSRATGGLGLGLMFVRQIVTLHGGTIQAANRVEGGLRVTLDLDPTSGRRRP